MLSQEAVLEILRQSQPYLSVEYGVKRLGLFGSYAKGHPDENSDIDVIVEFERVGWVRSRLFGQPF